MGNQARATSESVLDAGECVAHVKRAQLTCLPPRPLPFDRADLSARSCHESPCRRVAPPSPCAPRCLCLTQPGQVSAPTRAPRTCGEDKIYIHTIYRHKIHIHTCRYIDRQTGRHAYVWLSRKILLQSEPAMPGLPGIPIGPWNPMSPSEPGGPGIPTIVLPAFPVAPLCPAGPRRPRRPSAPRRPRTPTCPACPTRPGGPCWPGEPSMPVKPIRPCAMHSEDVRHFAVAVLGGSPRGWRKVPQVPS